MAKYLAIVALGLFIALCFCGWLLKNSYEENGELETRNTSLTNAIYQQQELIAQKNKASDDYESILYEREKQINTLNKQNKEAYNEIKALREDDKAFSDWGNTNLPSNVNSLLNQNRPDSN